MGAVGSSYRGFASGFILATAARALLSTLFGLSLATLRLNATSLWTLVLLAPALALLLPRDRTPLIVATLATAALPFVRFTPAFVPTAALATAAAALALTQSSRAGLLGGLVGIGTNGAFLVAGRSSDPALTAMGAVIVLIMGAVAILSRIPARQTPTTVPAAAAWSAIILVEFAYLSSPYTLAAELGTSAWTPAILGLAGILLGAMTSTRRRFWLAAAALGIVDLAFVRSPLALISLLAVQGALAASATRLAPPQPAAFGVMLTALAFFVVFLSQPLGAAEWHVLVVGLLIIPIAIATLKPIDGSARAPRAASMGAVLAILFVLPALLPSSPVVDHQGDEIRVVTWNVHQGFGNRGGLDPDIYLDVLARLDPDILVLQESATTRYSSGGLDIVHLVAHRLGLRIATAGSDLSILTRFPAAAAGSTSTSWNAEAALDIHGTTVHVQGIHLARDRTDRARQVHELMEHANMTDGPRILAGDLNSCAAPTCFGGRPSDGVHQRLAVAYDDSWQAGDDGGFTHPAWGPTRRIDVILTRGIETLSSAPISDDETRLASDHLPIVAVLRVRAAGS